ncbi:unnamed protein product [Cuscuta epithymum]|uniref:Importin N-terminal domain-containing protein n=1 Tax=Cuscuta epithymum TaxID=186058 RepID=A0AAV0FHB4_9ASTE|nr:unnamed protein product [Cuscuta epithymum]CAH9134812.1 unnamed protein product [Cuscuta epithymum]
MESLAHLEAMCERLYNSQDSAERAHAENTLKCFSISSSYISQCQYILDNASSPYALIMASSSLLKQVTDCNLSVQLRFDIRNYTINYLATRGPDLESFVTTSLIQLVCRVTKYGWFEDDSFRDVVKESTNFLNQTPLHYAIGLKILNQLISEMNQPSSGLPPAQHRRVACSFRDELLLQIFQISLTSLSQLKNDAGSKLQGLAIALSLKCLSYDFMGITVDETSEDLSNIQIPAAWKQVIEDPSTVKIFFEYYEINESNFSKEVLECLVRLTSIRRSLFTHDAARMKYLSLLMTGTRDILQTGRGLTHHDNYHEFCRLLGRFKVNYQIQELVHAECYGDWIRLVAEFTMKSIQSWQWASRSVYYLLGLWSRLVSSLPYLKGDTPSLLNEFVPEIAKCYITSRFDSFQAGLPDPSENPLDNVELLQDQLECLPYLCRFQYESCSLYITQITDPLLQLYMEASELQVISAVETKLAWIVHIVAAIVKTKQLSSYSGESHEIHDAELSARVLRLINIADSGLHTQRYTEPSKQRLDKSILIFFQNFKSSYVGDQAIHSSKQLYAKLSELLGLHDHMLILNFIVGKIATNLKCYFEGDEVVDQSLNLMLEMASGYMTAKLLLKLDTTQLIISNRNREQFPFLRDHRGSRCRTTFYYILGLLIFMEDSLMKFKASMDPLLQVFLSLESIPDSLFRSDDVKQALIGLMRDLRGIAMATSSRRTYAFLFDWLYPAHMPLILKAITVWADAPEVTTPILKFVAEFVLNKSQRLCFETSSANGILLFREVSKLIVVYGSRLLSLPSQVDVYQFKYKGIWISLTILVRALCGDYVNFGVFEIYGDRALADALETALRMVLSIPLTDILVYRKLAAAYFTFLEALMKTQISFILNLDTNNFIFIAGSLESGLKVLDGNIKTQCASAVDYLATFYFECITSGESPSSPVTLKLAQHFSDCPNIFLEILKTLFELVLFEDCVNQWSLSRPMLSLILISDEMFSNLRAQITASQQVDQQQRLSLCFDKLMADITRSLDPKNREKFSSNIARFRNEFRTR